MPYIDKSFKLIDNLEFLEKVPKENTNHRDFLSLFVSAFKLLTKDDIFNL